jgi:hypothetical protein
MNDWVIDNWLGVVTFLIGLVLTWRLRTRPEIRWEVRGTRDESPGSYNSYARTGATRTRLRIRNVGTEVIEPDAIRTPITAVFAVPCTSAMPARARRRDLGATAELLPDDPRAVRFGFDRLDPGDWIEYRIDHPVLRLPPGVIGELRGGPGGLQPSLRPKVWNAAVGGTVEAAFQLAQIEALLLLFDGALSVSTATQVLVIALFACYFTILLASMRAVGTADPNLRQDVAYGTAFTRGGCLLIVPPVVVVTFVLLVYGLGSPTWHVPDAIYWALGIVVLDLVVSFLAGFVPLLAGRETIIRYLIRNGMTLAAPWLAALSIAGHLPDSVAIVILVVLAVLPVVLRRLEVMALDHGVTLE